MAGGAGPVDRHSTAESRRHSAAVSMAATSMAKVALLAVARPLGWATLVRDAPGTEATTLAVGTIAAPAESPSNPDVASIPEGSSRGLSFQGAFACMGSMKVRQEMCGSAVQVW